MVEDESASGAIEAERVPVAVRPLGCSAIHAARDALATMLVETVAAGGSIGFLAPLAVPDAIAFWTFVAAEVDAGRRTLVIAEVGGRVAGAVQLVPATVPDQPHRADVAKLMVAPWAQARRRRRTRPRGRGDGSRLRGRCSCSIP